MAKFFRVEDVDGNSISMENLESISNRVDSISSESTEDQYPSAKAVYDSLKLTTSFFVNAIERSEDNTLTVDKSSNEAYLAYIDGRSVYLKSSELGEEVLIPLISVSSSGDQKAVVYSSVLISSDVLVTLVIHTGTSARLITANLAVESQLDSKENKSNKVISLSSSSTDTQYPSAKCVYDLVGNVEDLLSEL